MTTEKTTPIQPTETVEENVNKPEETKVEPTPEKVEETAKVEPPATEEFVNKPAEKVEETVKVEPPAPETKVESVGDYIDSNKATEQKQKAEETVEPEATKSEADSKLSVLEKLAKDSLIKSSNVHPDLLPTLPKDVEELSTYLNSESFQRVNKTLHNVANQKPVEKTVIPTPPTEQATEDIRPKTFKDISAADQIELGKKLRAYLG